MARRLERLATTAPERCAILEEAAGPGASIEVGYGELNRRADRIADLLAASGAGPKSLVAIVLPPRSRALIASMCAVFKIGATCLPLDPDDLSGTDGLEEWARPLLTDAGSCVVLTTLGAAPRIPFEGRICILDDKVWDERADAETRVSDHFDSGPQNRAGLEPEPDDIACLVRAVHSDGVFETVSVSYADFANCIDNSRTLPAGVQAEAEAESALTAETVAVLELILPVMSGNRTVLGSLETQATSDRSVAFVGPRDEVEQVLAQVWCSVLDLARVGIHDRFFDLGGRSLMAVKVVARVRKLLNVELPLKALFDAPTIAELAEFVRRAAAAGEASGADGGDASAAGQIRRVERVVPVRLPLSFAQQRLWFLDQLVPGSAFYNMCDAFRVRGVLDVGALERALVALVERHEVLRTAFGETDGVPFQTIAAPDSSDALRVSRVARVDLTALPADGREDALRRLVAAEEQIPFRLSDGGLLRVVVARLADDDHVLVVTMHHVISDGWSMDVLIGEMGDLYEGEVEVRRGGAGKGGHLEPLSIQYADFAVWQRAWLGGGVVEGHLSYWRGVLEGVPSVVRLPVDRVRPVVQSHRGEVVEFGLSEGLVGGLEGLGRGQGVTLFMTLLGGFEVLLSRYCGDDDVVVGVPAACRTRAEVEPLVGFFVNTLPVRVRCEAGLSFRGLLERVREASLGAFAHQDLPFEMLVEALAPERDLSHNPLVQVTFQLLTTPPPKPHLPGARVERYPRTESVSQFDLSMDIRRRDDGSYAGIVNYCPDVYDRSRMDVLVDHYLHLLDEVVRDPDRRLDDVSMVGAEERRRLLTDFGRRDAPLAATGTILERFAEHVRRTPDVPAVVCGASVLTFAELDVRTAVLARRLVEAGVGAEVPVGVCLPRSVESVVALLAVMRAGGVYVPLDPEWPKGRLDHVLEDTAAPAVITSVLPEDPASGRVHVDPCAPALRDAVRPGDTDAWVDVRVDPDQAAYIIYTSGSTGTPKGVTVQHRSLNHLTSALQTTFLGHDPFLDGPLSAPPVARRLRATLTASFTFDASMEQLSWMFAGHELHIVSGDVRRDPAALVRFVDDHRIDVIDTTSSQLELLTEAGLFEGEWAPGMVMVGGEAVSPALWRTLREQTRTRCFNLYGPTEATVDATCQEISAAGEVPVIGVPLPDVCVRILDERMRPVPIGVAGELYLGGPGLARGYHGRPDLTARRFVADPYADTPGERLYRTGDRGRWRPDGSIEYVGRVDDQIKLRGYRIEPGEIETVLTHHPAVKEAAVIDDEHARLIAYVTLRAGAGAGAGAGGRVDTADVRRFVQGRLPDYMVPSAVVVMGALPLTPNGKLDRRELPVPEVGRPDLPNLFVGPRDAVEDVMAQAWCSVLGLDRVGVHDDFFELGGHSLLAIQVVSRVRKLLDVELPLRVLFDAPTIAELAGFVRAAAAGEASGTGGGDSVAPERIARVERVERVMPVDGVEEEGEGEGRGWVVPVRLPLSFAQQRLWFLDQLVPGSAFYNMCDAFRVRGVLDVGALERALVALVERHEVLRTAFGESDGVPFQVVSPLDDPDALRAAHITRVDLAEDQSLDWVAAEAKTPFRLSDGALLRVALGRLADDDHVLVVTMHHIISDGWSVEVLIDELGRLYREAATGVPADLPALDVQYADFAVWQRAWLGGGVVEGHLSYWRGVLEGAPSVVRLPVDRVRPVVQSHRGEVVEFGLSEGLVAGLEGLGRGQGVTLFMALLGGFEVLLSRYCGDDDVVVGVPAACRTRAEVEPLVGFFVNTLPVRVRCEAGLSFRGLLERVREASLGAFAHQDLPFEMLVEALAPERDLSHNPLVQVTFQLLGAPDEKLALHGTTCEPLSFDGVTSRFDLSLDIIDGKEGKRGVLTYCPDLFDRSRMETLVGHYLNLLAGAVRHPDLPLEELPLADEAERLRLLEDFGRQRDGETPGTAGMAETPGTAGMAETPGTAGTAEATIPAALAGQVRSTPDVPAVVCGASVLTFAELDVRTAVLARRLVEAGVGAEVPVGVCLPRSVESVVALLAVMRAGGVYVPLDPEWPKGRLDHVLEDTAAPVVITSVLPEDLASGRVYVDPCAPALRDAVRPGDTDAWVDVRVDPDQAAYIIYTSGSTGTPKGVTVQHRSLHHLLHHVRGMADGDGRLTIAHTTAMTFDPSLEQLLWMVAGHTLHVVPDEVRRDPEALVKLLQRDEIDVLNVTPSHLTMLVEAGLFEGERVPGTVLVGGEAVPPALWRVLREQRGRTRCFNLYGPTEATVDATCQELSVAGEVPVIGKPLPHVRVRVLDERMRPVPVGVAGEIYLGGPGLARGYHRRPDLTAQRFVADPYADTPGERLHRTGDRGRWRPDGTLEYVGRVDHQIKLRGYRIEPGEIETVLTHHPAVKEAAVTVGADDDSHRLLALVALNRDAAPVDAARTDAVPVDAPCTDAARADAARADAARADAARADAARTDATTDDAASADTTDDDRAQVQDWNTVFEETHLDAADGELTFNIKGWNDSLTGEPIPAEHMAEWVDTTVDRLLDRQVGRVLEVGCGTGLLLWRLLPHVAEYTGTDFSRPVIEWLRAGLSGRPEQQVRVHHREATDFTGIAAGAADLVVINSVVQYFPDRDYLDTVMEHAVAATADGGRVFIGDVRNLALAPQFYARQARANAGPDASDEEVRRAAVELAERDSELLISPAYFTSLAARSPRVGGVEIVPRRGRFRNEMSLYRYDVVLHLGERPASTSLEPEVITWGDTTKGERGNSAYGVRGNSAYGMLGGAAYEGAGLHHATGLHHAPVHDLQSLSALLTRRQPPALLVRGIPNDRLTSDNTLLDPHPHREEPGGAEEAAKASQAVDPEHLWALAQTTPYTVALSWAAADPHGAVDAFLVRRDTEADLPPTPLPPPTTTPPTTTPPITTPLTNTPTRHRRATQQDGPAVTDGVRSWLADRLPAHLMPAKIIEVDALPRTGHGKLDRGALRDVVARHRDARSSARVVVPPRTVTERVLAEAWAQVLGLQEVGVHDNFFTLGGDSLLATRAVARSRRGGVQVTVRQLLRKQTVASLAAALDEEIHD
ncbi:amino acid adenylation domain-containing protein [Streptomyces venezuelae]|uniref:amino acid adenylation domain-containing protein n=1 Tax=Streptomyces venezuelae TaxID=54571 RepID=UPI003455C9B6